MGRKTQAILLEGQNGCAEKGCRKKKEGITEGIYTCTLLLFSAVNSLAPQ